MALEALDARLKLVVAVAAIRHQIIAQVKPEQPTKALEAANLLKLGMQAIGTRLSDPEPSPVAISEEQITIASFKNSQVLIRAKRLYENLARVAAMLMADHEGHVIAEWTPEQVAAWETHLTDQVTALETAIDDL